MGCCLETAPGFFGSADSDLPKPHQTADSSTPIRAYRREWERAASAAKIGDLGTHSFGDTQRMRDLLRRSRFRVSRTPEQSRTPAP